MNKKRKIIIIIGLVLTLIIGFSILHFSTKPLKNDNDNKNQSVINIEELRATAELATLKCFYHNTAKLTDPSKFLFFIDTTKTLWIEYSGIITIGVDISKIEMDSKGNTIHITMPEAQIIGCKVDSSSLTEDNYITETRGGIFSGKIDHADQARAFSEAQSNMNNTAANDKNLILQGTERAKELLKNYIDNIGKQLEEDYEIEWTIIKNE